VTAARLRAKLINIAGFQAVWLACLLGAGYGHWLSGPVVLLLWLPLHLAVISRGGAGPAAGDAASAKVRRRGAIDGELRLVGFAVLLGYFIDSLHVFLGLIDFPPHSGPALPTTPWMLALWAGFATTLRHSMGWMRRRYALSALAGVLFSPLPYLMGERFNAIEVKDGWAGLPLVASTWGLAMPVLLWLRERVETVPLSDSEAGWEAGGRMAAEHEGRR